MERLAERLIRLGYSGLFLRPPPAVRALWQEKGMPEALAALAADAAQPAAGRFLAAEAVADRSGALPAVPPADLAEAYATVLHQSVVADMWGLPGAPHTPPARHLLALGEAAAAAMRPLLQDDSAIDYGGSEEATLAYQARWRVKDLAASFLAAIRGEAFDAGAPAPARDTAIARMIAAP
ncbi:hypothetical protein [Roseomonas sp. AR75]|uniref:hypothetical protein n=1 Tax=Roseomonas sp. AR75 TaxID=2562311 RepID=UPI0010C153B1|nr:hypothetical protein [Roseomonas sp. AR75]